MKPGGLFLVGFMGSGKTTVGPRVAERLQLPFLDTDRSVELREGRPVHEIFQVDGEQRFRQLEAHALASTASGLPAVVATGGGLFARREHRAWIRAHGVSCWLDVPLERARRRVGDAGTRPVWTAGDALGIRSLFEIRRATYALADFRVGADDDPDRVAAAVATRFDAVFR